MKSTCSYFSWNLVEINYAKIKGSLEITWYFILEKDMKHHKYILVKKRIFLKYQKKFQSNYINSFGHTLFKKSLDSVNPYGQLINYSCQLYAQNFQGKDIFLKIKTA